MRIIGGSDFYDGCMAYGRDDSVLFKRDGGRRLTSSEVHEGLGVLRRVPSFVMVPEDADRCGPRRGRLALRDLRRSTQEVRLRDGTVAFHAMHAVLCGTLHSGIAAIVTRSWPHRRDVTRIWRADALTAFCAELGLEIRDAETRTGQDQRTDQRGMRYQVDVRTDSLADWFTPVPVRPSRAERMIGERITIITRDPEPIEWGQDARDRPWIVDGTTLGAMGFAKAVDPHTAYQEIAMWNGGVLGSEGPGIVEITDDRIKAEKHGFHHPTSFRRAKAER